MSGSEDIFIEMKMNTVMANFKKEISQICFCYFCHQKVLYAKCYVWLNKMLLTTFHFNQSNK